jgi:hypothetical protein
MPEAFNRLLRLPSVCAIVHVRSTLLESTRTTKMDAFTSLTAFLTTGTNKFLEESGFMSLPSSSTSVTTNSPSCDTPQDQEKTGIFALVDPTYTFYR